MSYNLLHGDMYWTSCYELLGKRQKMEDSHGIAYDQQGRVMVAVADGLGGLPHGEFASKTVIDVLTNSFIQIENFGGVKAFLKKSIFVASSLILQQGIIDPEYKESATTLSGVIIDKDKTIYTVNSGDSRVYFHRQGETFKLTKDQTPVQDLLNLGLITEEEALVHPDKHLMHSAIDGNVLELSFDIQTHGKVQKGDMFVVSTDGFHDVFTTKQVNNLLQQYFDRTDIAKLLAESAYNNGSRDNITVCILKVF